MFAASFAQLHKLPTATLKKLGCGVRTAVNAVVTQNFRKLFDRAKQLRTDSFSSVIGPDQSCCRPRAEMRMACNGISWAVRAVARPPLCLEPLFESRQNLRVVRKMLDS